MPLNFFCMFLGKSKINSGLPKRVFFGGFWGEARKLVGGFKYFLFSTLPGEMIQFD